MSLKEKLATNKDKVTARLGQRYKEINKGKEPTTLLFSPAHRYLMQFKNENKEGKPREAHDTVDKMLDFKEDVFFTTPKKVPTTAITWDDFRDLQLYWLQHSATIWLMAALASFVMFLALAANGIVI